MRMHCDRFITCNFGTNNASYSFEEELTGGEQCPPQKKNKNTSELMEVDCKDSNKIEEEEEG